jgi:acetyl esterase/lipase
VERGVSHQSLDSNLAALQPGAGEYALRRIESALISVFLAFGAGCAAARQTPEATGAPTDIIEKVSRPMVWEPGPDGNQVPLWPDGLAIQRPESDKPEEVGNGSRLVAGRPWNWASNVSRPTMTIYRPKGKTTRAAVLVLPGGGYAAVAMDLEGTEICDWITREGMTCILLKYRVPQAWRHGEDHVEEAPKVQLPLQDAQRAMGLLRERASSYGVDPHKIGVIGFSAGGHLAAAVSNAEKRTYEPVDAADRESSRPDFAVLLYPGHLWEDTKPGLALSPWVEISAKAPPTLLIHAMNDPTDDVRHSIAYGLALNAMSVPVDMRLYAKGGHAFGLRPTSAPITTEWPGLVVKWLENIGVR